jgi:hypothetical protein
MLELAGVVTVVVVAATTSTLLAAQISVGPELPETYWRLPVGDIHWTPNSQSLPLLGVVASHTSTG